jgi:hypothetical protein
MARNSINNPSYNRNGFRSRSHPCMGKQSIKEMNIHAALMKLQGYKEGDRLKVVSNYPSHTNGWDSFWSKSKTELIDEVGVVVRCDSLYGYIMKFPSKVGVYGIPAFVVKKAEQSFSLITTTGESYNCKLSEGILHVGCSSFYIKDIKELLKNFGIIDNTKTKTK